MMVLGQPWGRLQGPHVGPIVTSRSRHDPFPSGDGPWLAWGNGRSYGDVCCNSTGTLIESRGASRIFAFDAARGRIACESGVLLADLQRLLIPHGWFLPVVPGTELVTVGGAIANDVHGKNHHRQGSFGDHVRWLEVLQSDGTRTRCGPAQFPGRFAAVVGGLGLTGLITAAEIALKPLPGSGWLQQRTRRTRDLDETLAVLGEVDRAQEHTAAWLDCQAQGRRLGRGLVLAAEHDVTPLPRPGRRRRRGVPFTPPVSPMRPWTLMVYNGLYYHLRRGDSGWQRRWYRSALHPLDHVRDWNRLYGRSGFVQCQVVVPEADHAAVLRELLRLAAQRGEHPSLVVLKRFGDRPGTGLLSFPRSGYTLALDFPWRGPRTGALVRELYDVALAAGGSIYPAKDAVMTPVQFRRAFPQYQAFRSWLDPGFGSDFARRVRLA